MRIRSSKDRIVTCGTLPPVKDLVVTSGIKMGGLDEPVLVCLESTVGKVAAMGTSNSTMAEAFQEPINAMFT